MKRLTLDTKNIVGWQSAGITANGSRLGEVAEHKTSLVVQILKFR